MCPNRPHLLHFRFLGVDELAGEGLLNAIAVRTGVVPGMEGGGGGGGNGIGRCCKMRFSTFVPSSATRCQLVTSTLCTRSFHQSGTRFSIWQNVYQCV
jgi:hypothetical protein